MAKKGGKNRVEIINSVKTYLQFATLVVLVVEGVLLYLLSNGQPEDIRFYVTIMVIVLILIIIVAAIVEIIRMKLPPQITIPPTGEVEDQRKKFTYDVFLSAPMAAVKDSDYELFTKKILEIKAALMSECDFGTIYYAAENIKTKDKFEAKNVAIKKDLNALKDSRIFIMIFPEEIVSSVLFEAGFALSLGKPSHYFGHTDNFPFLMQEANNVFDFVKIHNEASLESILATIKINKSQLFELQQLND